MNRKVEFSGWQALERIPENCGCGGRATVCRGSTNPPYFWVECEDCHVSTMAAMKLTEAEAIAVWNTAMGAKDINVPDKYEYHINHTDCIWYWNGKGKCPSTCSQYRDGWNDAMNYVYKDGKGYSPYRRSE